MAPVFAFGTYSILSNIRHTAPLLSASAFSSLTILALLSQAASTFIDSVHGLYTATAGFARVQEFLTVRPRSDYRTHDRAQSPGRPLSEIQHLHDVVELAQPGKVQDQEKEVPQSSAHICVTVWECNVRWEMDTAPVLSNVSFEILEGSLTAVIGPVACGKSTLLQTVLGEVPYIRGVVRIAGGRVSYCCQSPWIFNASIKDNIVAQSGFDPAWYRTVLSVCALDKDLSQLHEGEDTMVGSNGSALSGGQKTRVVRCGSAMTKDFIDVDRLWLGVFTHGRQFSSWTILLQGSTWRRSSILWQRCSASTAFFGV